jgi:hypothetical protein
METSLLKTLANKHCSSVSKMARKYGTTNAGDSARRRQGAAGQGEVVR